MYEKILVPLDGSELAEVALPYAEELAGRLSSEVTLLYVSEMLEDPYQHMHESYLGKMIETTRQGIKSYLEKPGMPAIQVKSEILFGNPAERIVDYAEKTGTGLIVMSTHGRSGVKRWTLGSVADKVVRATTRPVALIRARGAHPDVRQKGLLVKALVPLDGSKEGETVLPYIEELASKLKAEVVLLQVLATGYAGYTPGGYGYLVYTEQEMQSIKEIAMSYLGNIGNRLMAKGVATNIIAKFGNAAEEIISYAVDSQADVVVMSTHGRSGISRWVFGSVAERVLYEGNTPLLLVRAARTDEK